MSYVYIQSEMGGKLVYTVGFYKPDGTFEPESIYDTRSEAAKRVHYLNGGAGDWTRTPPPA